MKKKLFVFFIVIITFFGDNFCYAQEISYEQNVYEFLAEEQNTEGIKKTKETVYTAKISSNGKIDIDKRLKGSVIYSYNKNGTPQKRAADSYNQSPNDITKFYYSKKGYIKQKIWANYYNKFTYNYYYIYTLQSDNETEVSKYDDEGNLKHRFVIKHTRNRLRQLSKNEVYIYNHDGELLERYIFDYNKNGFISKELKYDDTDSLLHCFSYNYELDEMDNWIKKIKFSKDGKASEVTIREVSY